MDDLCGRFRTEKNSVKMLRRNDRELLDDEPVKMLALNLLACDIIEWNRIEIGEQGCGICGGLPISRHDGERITYP